MKKYKLIQTYPSLPKSMEVGNIVEWNDTFQKYHHPKTLDIFRKGEIENYPNIWEEIKENYEILSLKAGKEIFTKDLRYEGLGERWYRKGSPSNEGYYPNLKIGEKYVLEPLEIHSIMRFSDGKIFTIGDTIKSSIDDYSFTIKGFDDRHQEGQLGAFGEENNWIHIDYIKILSFKLVTEDGVTITDPDQIVYCIENNTNLIFGCLARAIKEDKCKVFASEEKRDEYKIKNTPLLSYFDIEELIDDGKIQGSFIEITKSHILKLAHLKSKK